MKVWMRGRLACFTASQQRSMSAIVGAGQAADHRVPREPGDLAHRLEVAVRGDREARLDDVDAHLVEQRRDLQLLVEAHGGAGRLLAVAQGGVEDQDAVLGGVRVGHGIEVLGLRGFWRRVRLPLSARAGTRARSEAAKQKQSAQPADARRRPIPAGARALPLMARSIAARPES